ncbi:MAG: hypothetical protein CSA66_00005 [Proteobacteria bacterium]|nr:MAG: hypothetical protein CSA66_00005 [Pseudomonadota bacterium]
MSPPHRRREDTRTRRAHQARGCLRGAVGAILCGVERWETIDDPPGVKRVAAALQAARWVGLSLETNAMHAYRARICLLQIALPSGERVALDAVALRGRPFALRPLEAPLQDAARPVIVHGGEHLVAALKREHRIALAGIVDTQQAAVLLGWPRTGYRALVERVVGAAVPPPISRDWAARPLPEGAIEYALEDVRHLGALARAIGAEIAAHDLADELAIACQQVAWTPADIGRFDPDGFYRLKGAHRLPPAALRVLREVWLWREAKARHLDVPPGKLLPNRELLELARRPPAAVTGLRRVQFHSRLLYGDRQELLNADAVSPAGRPRGPGAAPGWALAVPLRRALPAERRRERYGATLAVLCADG